MRNHIYYLIAVLFLVACTKNSDSGNAIKAPDAISVKTVKIADRDMALPYYIEGCIISKNEAVISSKISAKVESSFIEVGRNVKKGELLLTLSANEINAKLNYAKANYAKIERELNREGELLKKGASTDSIVKDLRDALNAADSQVREAAAYLSYTKIYAPISGVVAAKNVDIGDLVLTGTRLCEITDMEALQVEANVPSSLVSSIIKERTPEILKGRKTYKASLSEVAPKIDTFTKTRIMKFDITTPADFSVGEFVRIKVPSEKIKVLLVPENCISKFGQIDRVFVVKNSKVEMRIVKLGEKVFDEFYIAKSGLESGEEVVVSPNRNVKEGVSVR